MASGFTERGLNDFIRHRGGFVVCPFRLFGEWVLQDFIEALEGFEIALVSCLNRFFNAMVARNENRVRLPH